MKYSVDRIENDIAVLQNIQNNDIKEVKIENLPHNIKESDIVRIEDNKYVLDTKEKEEILKRVREKFNNLKK